MQDIEYWHHIQDDDETYHITVMYRTAACILSTNNHELATNTYKNIHNIICIYVVKQ